MRDAETIVTGAAKRGPSLRYGLIRTSTRGAWGRARTAGCGGKYTPEGSYVQREHWEKAVICLDNQFLSREVSRTQEEMGSRRQPALNTGIRSLGFSLYT